MSESERESGVLTREELDAILETLSEARASEGSAPFRSDHETGATGPLVRGLREFAEEQGRALSALHQRSLGFQLMTWEPVGVGDFAESLLEGDLVVALDIEPGTAPGYLVLGRTLVFGWLTLAFGAPHGMRCETPQRSYTRIEERFLLRAAREIAAQLQSSLSPSRPVTLAVSELVEPAMLQRQGSPRLRMASFDVTGFEDVCRLRIVLPEGLMERGRDAPELNVDAARSPLRERLLRMPVRLHAEVGGLELSLRRLAALREGDVLPLDRADAGGLVVCVENEPKFRGERGAVGQRLAVQLGERL